MRPSQEFDQYLVQCTMQRDATYDPLSRIPGAPLQNHAQHITREVERYALPLLNSRIELWEGNYSPDPHAYPNRKVITASVAIVPGRTFRRMLGLLDQIQHDNVIAWRHRSEIEEKAERRAAAAEARVRELEAQLAEMSTTSGDQDDEIRAQADAAYNLATGIAEGE